MSLVTDAVEEMEKKLAGSGCDHGTVVLAKSPEKDICPFIEGTCIEASYGGKRIFIATSYPIEVKTRVSFMYGQELNSPVQRTAACAILNSLSSFMCFTRISGACPEGCGKKCLDELKEETADRQVYLNGTMTGLQKRLEDRIVADPEDADVIIVSGDGMFSDEGLEICDRYRNKKEMIFFAPGTSGLAGILNLHHWCPYGRK